MKWEMVKLGEVIEKPISGEWGEGEGETPVLRTTNFRNDGSLNFENVVKRNISEKKIREKSLKPGDCIIEKSGGGPSQPVGRVVYFDNPRGVYLCNNFTSIIRHKAKVSSKYLFWYLFNNHLIGNTLSYQNKTTGIINLQLERYITESKIPLPPLATQQRIADILDKADALRRKDQALLQKYDELAQAVFVDMFGDLSSNNYTHAPLEEVASIVNGVTKNEKLQTSDMREVPYLRVANVQDNFLDLKEIKTIKATARDVDKYQLIQGDILLTEGGDADKLGRGTIWNEEIPHCIFQNHLFRVRVTSQNIIPHFLNKLVGSPYGKKYFLKAAKQTTGIATINTSQLKAFPVIIPSLKEQLNYMRIESHIKKTMASQEATLSRSTALFQSLLQKAFTGELVP